MKSIDKKTESFFTRVYEVARKIPYGRVTTYGHIAEFIGAKGSARMVGWAMNATYSTPFQVPAHRVVNRKGILTGKNHFPAQDLMQKLLEKEGIKVINDQIIDFEKVLWIPIQEIKR